MRKHLLAIAVILTVAAGCDNVAWGGIDVALKAPPPSSRGRTAAVSVDEDPPPDNFDGPILLAGVRDGSRAEFVVVGEVHPDELRVFPDPNFPEDVDRLSRIAAPGSEWILFSEGVRIGRMVVDATQRAPEFCGSPTTLSGVIEVVPTAAAAERLLALPTGTAAGRPYEDYRPISHVYDQRVATNSLATEAIPEYGATWPRLGVLDARKHIQAFQIRNAQLLSVAATFMNQDELDVSSPGQGAYSLFVIGRQVGEEYQRAYVSYRSVEADGKGAPRYFDHLDWDGDGTDEILLDVFGANRRWFAALSSRDGSWIRTFQSSCGSGGGAGS